MTYRIFVQLEKQANHPNVAQSRSGLRFIGLIEACEDCAFCRDSKLKSDCKCIIRRRLWYYRTGKREYFTRSEIIIGYEMVKSVTCIPIYTRTQIMHMLDIR